MVAYVSALKQIRKNLLQNAEEQPTPSVKRTGMISAPRQVAQEQTAAAAKTYYEPAKFVHNGVRSLRETRLALQKANITSGSSAGSFAKGIASSFENKKKEAEEKNKQPLVPYRDAPDGPKGKEVYDIPQISGSASVKEDAEFIAGVKELAAKYNTTPAELMSLMHFESAGSFSPSKKNSIGATGLIQFIPSTAKGLGTSTDQLAGMTRKEQLQWVDKYLGQTPISKVEKPTGEDLYMSVLWPKAVGKPSDYVLWKEGSREYKQNKGLDIGGKGYITKRDAAQKAMQYVDFYGDI